jgi:hypothetical protein
MSGSFSSAQPLTKHAGNGSGSYSPPAAVGPQHTVHDARPPSAAATTPQPSQLPASPDPVRPAPAPPAAAAISQKGGTPSPAWDPLEDLLRGPTAGSNPIRYDGPRRLYERTADDALLDVETGLRETDETFMPVSARIARRREAEQQREEEEAEQMRSYMQAHFQQFSAGRSLSRMAERDADHPERAPRRHFTYFPKTVLSETGLEKVSSQNLNYCAPHRRGDEFVARVRVTAEGVEPVYRSRVRRLDDQRSDAAKAALDEAVAEMAAFEEMTALERQDYERSNRLRPWRETANANVDLPESDGSFERKLGWKQGDVITEEERRRVKAKRRLRSKQVKILTVTDQREEKEYAREHFQLNSGGRSVLGIRPRDRQLTKSREAAFVAAERGATNADDDDEALLLGGTWERREAERRQRLAAAQQRALPQLKRGRNIVLEQLNRRRSQSKPTVEEDERSLRSDGAPPGVDRSAAEYAML